MRSICEKRRGACVRRGVEHMCGLNRSLCEERWGACVRIGEEHV